MKTTNNAQKTENRKFKNTITKTFAVVASLILISITVSANGFWKQILVNNAYGKMATLIVDQNNTPASPLFNEPTTEVTANEFYFKPEQEAKLQIESWMTNNKYFNSAGTFEQISPEKNLEIESWMLDNPYFSNTAVETDSEPALEIESWMTDPMLWGSINQPLKK